MLKTLEDNTASGATATATGRRMVLRSEIKPDPQQPRKEFRNLQELADSFGGKAEGILECLKVTEMPDGNFLLVDGERRWRAAELAGLERLPIEVIAPADVLKAQIIFGTQRENLNALEEANSAQKLFEQRRALNPKFSVDDLAKELGKSRAVMYEFLALNRLQPDLRAALEGGKISMTVARYIGLIPDPSKQREFLEEKLRLVENGFAISVRDVQEEIEDQFYAPLKSAPFDTEKTYTGEVKLKEGGTLLLGQRGPCTKCVFRTGNMLEEFPHLKDRPQVCTQPACHAGKIKAAAQEKVEAANLKGLPTLSEKELRARKGEFVEGGKVQNAENRWGDTWQELMGKHAPTPVLVATADGVKKFFPKEEATAAAKKNGVKLYKEENRLTPEQQQARDKERENKVKAMELLVLDAVPRLATALDKMPDKQLWELLIEIGPEPWKEVGKRLLKAVKTTRGEALVRLLDHDLVYYNGNWNDAAVQQWKLAGIDLMAEEKAASEKAKAKTPAELPGMPAKSAEKAKGKVTLHRNPKKK